MIRAMMPGDRTRLPAKSYWGRRSATDTKSCRSACDRTAAHRGRAATWRACAGADLPRAADTKLPPLLVRPGHLDDRDVDAAGRAGVARVATDGFAARARDRDGMSDRAGARALALCRGRRGPRAE